MNGHISTSSQGSADLPSPHNGMACELSDSASETNTASTSSASTGQMYPSTETSSNLMGDSMQALTSSPGATRASPSPLPGSEEARKMTVTSGLKCYESYKSVTRLGSLAKTLLGTSTWDSSKCVLTWKVKAMKSNRLLFQLVPSVPRTAGLESGLLPTASVCGNHNRKGASKTSGDGLATVVRMLPTPQARDYRTGDAPGSPRNQRKADQGWSLNVNDVVRMLPAPTAHLAKEQNSPAEYTRNTPTIGAQIGLKLHPNFVEWMMGFPIDHTALSHWEIRSCRTSRRKSSKQSTGANK